MKKMLIKGVDDLPGVASMLLSEHPDARLIAFYGEMGSGKTTFIKALCRCLGVNDPVVSPTFALINEYRTLKGEPVFHFDFYRIRNLSEVYDIGYEEYFYSGGYCFLEWPELVASLLPENTLKVHISMDVYTGERFITFPGRE